MPDVEANEVIGMAGPIKAIGLLVTIVFAIGLILYAAKSNRAATKADNLTSTLGGPFELAARDGSTVTNQTLAGKPYAIFFGYTRCPDVCPTSLARMARLRKQLGADGKKFNIVFVSVDPEHDKPADIASYVDMFGTAIIGLTGTEAQLNKIKKRFGVFVRRVPMDPSQPEGDYTIDHTAAIYLMSATGALIGTIDHQESNATALEKVKRLIA